MKGSGIVVGLLGVAIAAGSLFYPTSVDVSTVSTAYNPLSSLGSDPPQLSGAVFNLGRLQEQMMLFVCGVALAVIGVVLFAAGTAVERISSGRSFVSDGVLITPAEPIIPAPVAEPRGMTDEEIAEMDRAGNMVVLVIGGIVAVMFVVALIAVALSR